MIRKRIKIKNLMYYAYKIKFMINDIQYNFKAKYNSFFEDFLKKYLDIVNIFNKNIC